MIEDLLSKSSGETLSGHTISCLLAAQSLLSSLPLEEVAIRGVEADVVLAIAIHDIGKAASGFQRVLRGEQRDWAGKRHEVLSAAFASALPGISEAALLAIVTHHKALPPDAISTFGAGCLPLAQLPLYSTGTPIWEEMASEWQENQHLLRQHWSEICEAIGRDDLARSVIGLACLSLNPAWLNRSKGKSGQRTVVSYSDRYHASLIRGLTISADHLGSAHFFAPAIPNFKNFAVLSQNARPFQEVAGTTRGSAILRAPTGSGKTEAALLWAQHNQQRNGRLFYVLPYTASINAMYRRLGPGNARDQQGIFGSENVGLLHSRATAALYAIRESEGEDCSRLQRQETARALGRLAREMWFPIRVCTPHQLLRYMLRGKGWETMLAEFPHACLVFDEVHAYDPRVVGLTLAMARRLSDWGARSLFVSATLPDFLAELIRRAMGPIPAIAPDQSEPRDQEILNLKRHHVSIEEGSLLSSIEQILAAANSSGSTLIVCNHVRTAQEVYAKVESLFGHEVVLLHGHFNQEDRNQIEGALVRGPLPKVLVATQVVEVSLDVDFDQAFLEPAPIDALVQRMGRVNRLGMREPARIVILTEQVNRFFLYCDCTGRTHETCCRVRRSIEELRNIQNPVSETDLVDAANRVYSGGYQDKDLRAFNEGFNHPDIADFEDRLLAGAHQDWIEQVIESADGTVQVLPKSLLAEYEQRRLAGLWLDADSLLVPLRVKSLGALRSKIDRASDPMVVHCPYSQKTGLQLSYD